MRRLSCLLPWILVACTAAPTPSGAIVHNVFFELSEPSTADELSRACRDQLAPIPGILRLDVGPRETSQAGDFNDTQFHVALTVVFESVAALEAYLIHPDHLAFVEEILPGIAGVRVFDSVVDR